MKRLISLVLACVLAVGIVSCGKPAKQSSGAATASNQGTNRPAPSGAVYSLAGKSDDDIKSMLTVLSDVKDGDKLLDYTAKFEVQPDTFVVGESKTDYAYYFPVKGDSINCITDITLLEVELNPSEAILTSNQSMVIISMHFDDVEFAKKVYDLIDGFRSDMTGFSVFDESKFDTADGLRWSKDIRRDDGSPLRFNLSLYPEDSHYIVYAQIPVKK